MLGGFIKQGGGGDGAGLTLPASVWSTGSPEGPVHGRAQRDGGQPVVHTRHANHAVAPSPWGRGSAPCHASANRAGLQTRPRATITCAVGARRACLRATSDA